MRRRGERKWSISTPHGWPKAGRHSYKREHKPGGGFSIDETAE